jgi:Cytidylyltransferase-like
MDSDANLLISAIHQTSCSCVLAVTGGGATAAGCLLTVPGASHTILEVQTPYSEESLCQFLGKRPEGFCTTQTSMDLAEAAWSRAMILRSGGTCVGIGCTASLATDRPKRGDHRFYAAAAVEEVVRILSVTFEKGARSRAEEERVVSRAILNLLGEAVGLNDRLEVALRPGEVLKQETHDRGALLSRFARRDLGRLCAMPDGRFRDEAVQPPVLLPGSFNPLHEGHWALVRAAAKHLHLPTSFELSMINVDKPPLGLAEIRRRLAQFHGRSAVWLTHAPTFVEKASIFPGCIFVVGLDTAERLVAPQYYQGGELGVARAADEFRAAGCRFLVAARTNREGQHVGLEDIAAPNCFHGLLEAIPKEDFNMLISSSELRQRASQTHASSAD